MRKLVLAAVTAAILGGCATVPAPIAGDNFSTVTPRQAATEKAGGQHVRWGGEIIKVEPRADVTCFEVLSRELWSDARPNRRDHSDGRFIACSKGFYDPALYTRGRDLTITGTVNGVEQHKVGEYQYTYAQVDADQVYLWPERQYTNAYPYAGWYDPFWGPYWGPYWGWGPSVVVVRGHGHHH